MCQSRPTQSPRWRVHKLNWNLGTDLLVTPWSLRSFAGTSRRPKMGSGRLLPSTEHPFNERSNRKEIRCPCCNKLIGKVQGREFSLETVCPRCNNQVLFEVNPPALALAK